MSRCSECGSLVVHKPYCSYRVNHIDGSLHREWLEKIFAADERRDPALLIHTIRQAREAVK